MSAGEKKVQDQALILKDVKAKLGYSYAKKIAAKSTLVTNRQVFDVYRGALKGAAIVNEVLRATAAAIEEEEAAKEETERLKKKIIS